MAHSLSTLNRLSDAVPHRLMGTAILSIFIRGLGPLSAFLLTLVLARGLGASATGAFYLTTTLMTCCAIVAKFGFDNALQRFAGGAAGRGDWAEVLGVYKQACHITATLSVVIVILLLFLSSSLSEWLLENEFKDLLFLIILAVVPFAWLGIQAAGLKAIGHPAWGGFIEVGALPTLSVALVGGYALFAPLTVYAVAGCYLIAAACSALLGTWLLQHHLPNNLTPRPVTTQRLLNSCVPLTLVELMNYLILWSPLLFLGALASNNDAGLYNVSHRLAAQLSLIALVFASITAPRFACFYQKDDLDGLQTLASRSTRLMTLLCLPPAAVLILAAAPILDLFGDEFSAAQEILVILVLAQLVSIITGPVGYLLTMTGHEQTLRNLLMGITTLTLILSLLLIPSHGALGAAWTVFISISLENLICCWLVKQRLNVPFWLLLAPTRPSN